MEKIINEIKNIELFTLKDFYLLINKYGKSNVIIAFKNLLLNEKCEINRMTIIRKYSSAFIFMEIEISNIISKDTYLKLCKKYGKDSINNFINELEEISKDNFDIENVNNFINELINFEDDFEEVDSYTVQDNDCSDIDFDGDLVKRYLDEIGQIPLLSEKKTRELFEMYSNETDEKRKIKIRNEIANANLRLVVSIARKYAKSNYPILDMIQNGNIGLMKAIDKYDYKTGNAFSTYATWWINQTINRANCDQGRMIRLPVYVNVLLKQISTKHNKLIYELGREPTDEELANSVGISLDKFYTISAFYNDVLSLDVPININDDSPVKINIEDKNSNFEEKIFDEDLKLAINESLNELEPRKKKILEYRFGIGLDHDYTLSEVSKMLGISRERVRQIEKEALRNINSDLKKKRKLKPYLR